MTGRALGLLVLSFVVGVSEAGSYRPLPWLLVTAAAAAAWVARDRRWGWASAAIAATAWATAIGPWTGSTRWWLAAAVAVATGAVVTTATRRSPRIGAAAAAVSVGSALAFVTVAPTTGSFLGHTDLAAVDVYLRDQVDRGSIAGAGAVVVQGGERVFARGYGRAGSTANMTADIPVVIGSTSKSITAMAILGLVEDGRLQLDAPVTTYLTWLDPVDPRVQDITIRQLLVDTSGIPTWAGWNALAGDGEADPGAIRRLIDDIRLTSRPGARFQYSNANYIILGQVLEAVTGTSYAEVVRHDVFEPLGLTDAHAASTSKSRPNRYWWGLPVPSHLPYLAIGAPAGAITASANDLGRYLQAQLDPTRWPSGLSPAGVALSHTPAVTAEGFGVGPGRKYAMGWYTGEIAGERAVFHSGDVFDSSSTLILLPDRGIGIAVVATTSSSITPVAKTLGEGVAATLLATEDVPDLGRSLAVGTMLVALVGGVLLACAGVRARELLVATLDPRRRSSMARVLVVDTALPVAILVGLPSLFSTFLDRAETTSPLQFWTLATRGLPDAAALLLTALAVRAAAAAAFWIQRARYGVEPSSATTAGPATSTGAGSASTTSTSSPV